VGGAARQPGADRRQGGIAERAIGKLNAFRKGARIRKFLVERGYQPRLVPMFSADSLPC
jgi:hypothetical protein